MYKPKPIKNLEKREKQNEWLEFVFRTIPRDAKKTVFMHTALYIEDVNEVHAADKAKSLRQEHSLVLMKNML